MNISYRNSHALQLLKTYMLDHGSDSNWDDFKQILLNTFQSVDFYYRNRVKLTNLKQGYDSIGFLCKCCLIKAFIL